MRSCVPDGTSENETSLLRFFPKPNNPPEDIMRWTPMQLTQDGERELRVGLRAFSACSRGSVGW